MTWYRVEYDKSKDDVVVRELGDDEEFGRLYCEYDKLKTYPEFTKCIAILEAESGDDAKTVLVNLMEAIEMDHLSDVLDIIEDRIDHDDPEIELVKKGLVLRIKVNWW